MDDGDVDAADGDAKMMYFFLYTLKVWVWKVYLGHPLVTTGHLGLKLSLRSSFIEEKVKVIFIWQEWQWKIENWDLSDVRLC